MKLSEFDYKLPEELIAYYPETPRDKCKLMIYNRKTKQIFHKRFYEILQFIEKNDILILNNTKVFPARVYGKKETGARIEILFLKKISADTWEVLFRPAKRIKAGTVVYIDNFKITPLERREEKFIVRTEPEINYEILEKIGKIPLPPYIKRNNENIDKEYYQTVYAKEYGSVAGPTAGFHFTEELLEKVKNKGCKIGYITLHVGLGTFAPIRTEEIEKHKIEKEFVIIPEETVNLLKNKKGRCIAVGTTVVRALEGVATLKKEIQPFKGYVDLFIYPGYKFKIVDSLITNFHLPRSSLLLLVSAFAGKDNIKKLYEIAVKKRYRFYSYGDAMFII